MRKDENRMTKEVRMTNDENRFGSPAAALDFEHRHSFVLRPSSFVIASGAARRP
jgi:hypothetical protein